MTLQDAKVDDAKVDDAKVDDAKNNLELPPLPFDNDIAAMENVPAEEEEWTTSVPPRIQRQDKKVYAVSVRWEQDMEEYAEIHKLKKSNRRQCCFCLHYHILGNMCILWQSKDGTPIIIVGPRLSFCLSVTLPLIIGLSTLVCVFVIFKGKVPTWFAFVYIPMICVTIVTLSSVSCRNPGLLERVTEQENRPDGWYWNEQVGSYRPVGALYCQMSKVLVEDFDHFCPWTGTSIGRGNIHGFKSFLYSLIILLITTIGLLFYQFFV